MNLYYELFISFFKIGAFTIGGGYAMLPLIEKEVVDSKRWISKEEFLDMLAVSQASPGPIAVNISIFCGLRVKGPLGAFCTVLGTVLPSFIAILSIAYFFIGIEQHPVTIKIFKGIRPAVVALVLAPVFSLGKSAKINCKNVWVPVLCAVLVAFFAVTPVYLILVALAVAVGSAVYRNETKS